MLLRSPTSLHYPITVTELLQRPNDNVERSAQLFSYTYQSTVTEDDEEEGQKQVLKKYPAKFESSVDGRLVQWRIKAGDVMTGPK